MDYRQQAAQHWFGYGRWDAPYWFVGMEPGGTDEHTSYESWHRLGRGANLIDCREHHLDCNFTKWHSEQAPTQPTWRRLIQLLLAYKGRAASSMSAVSEYQQIAWGSTRGETAVLELSALHAPNIEAQVERDQFREQRILTLAKEFQEHRPTFAVFYGRTYRAYYERIIGASMTGGVALVDNTLCVLVPHPTAQSGPSNDPTFWIRLGNAMRLDVESRTITATAAVLAEAEAA